LSFCRNSATRIRLHHATTVPDRILLVARITFRLDDALHERLIDRASRANITPSSYLRALCERDEGGDPSGYHARFDDLNITLIQTFAILAVSVHKAAPETLEQGHSEARRLLRQRGLLDPAHDRA
jgi:hypothetical protein